MSLQTIMDGVAVNFFLPMRRKAEEAHVLRPAENDDLSSETGTGDSALMQRAGAGCAKAFAVLVERHTAALYRVSYRMLGDGGMAEDIVQECFVKLWKLAPNWQPKGAGLVGWLHRVAMNLCLDQLRKRSPVYTDTFPDLEDSGPLADRRIESRQARLAIERALDALPGHYRAALVLSYYEGFPNAVAAEAMDMNIKAFESLLVRARLHLRKLLDVNEIGIADLELLA